MSKSAGMTIDRRELLRLLGIGSATFTAASLAGPPLRAQTRKDTLILAVDFSDTVTLDPAHEFELMAPLIVASCYECLITMAPDDYVNVKPGLATSWQRTPDGTGWRFTLRDGVKYRAGTS